MPSSQAAVLSILKKGNLCVFEKLFYISSVVLGPILVNHTGVNPDYSKMGVRIKAGTPRSRT